MIEKFGNFKPVEYLSKGFFLFYGPNIGRVDYCIEKLKFSFKNNFKDINFLNYHSEDLSKMPFEFLINENNTLDIFGNKTCIILNLSDLKKTREIIKFLEKEKSLSCPIIFKCESLPKNNKLRSFIEKSENAVCVPCYEESSFEKRKIIQKFLNDHKIYFNDNEIDFLSQDLPNDFLEIQNELEKLVFFNNVKKKSIAEMRTILTNDFSEDLNNLVFLLASKRNLFWSEFLKHNLLKNLEIRFINLFLNHLEKLYFVKQKILDGMSVNTAVRSLRPNIFFKYENEFISQIDKWKREELFKTIKKFHICQSTILKGKKASRSEFLFLIFKTIN